MKKLAGVSIFEWGGLAFALVGAIWLSSLATEQFANPPERNAEGQITIRLSEEDWCGATPTEGCIVSDWNGIFSRYKVQPEIRWATLAYYGEDGQCARLNDRFSAQDTVVLVIPSEPSMPC